MCVTLNNIHCTALVDKIHEDLAKQIMGKHDDGNLRMKIADSLQGILTRCFEPKIHVSVKPKNDHEFLVTINGEN